jgi:hypothetical protein
VRFIQMSLVFVVGFFAALAIRVAVEVFEHPGDRTVQRIYAGFDRQFGGDDARWKVQSRRNANNQTLTQEYEAAN